jgi:hypothetical protein
MGSTGHSTTTVTIPTTLAKMTTAPRCLAASHCCPLDYNFYWNTATPSAKSHSCCHYHGYCTCHCRSMSPVITSHSNCPTHCHGNCNHTDFSTLSEGLSVRVVPLPHSRCHYSTATITDDQIHCQSHCHCQSHNQSHCHYILSLMRRTAPAATRHSYPFTPHTAPVTTPTPPISSRRVLLIFLLLLLFLLQLLAPLLYYLCHFNTPDGPPPLPPPWHRPE